MTISVDWPNRVIMVEKADMTLVGTDLYELDTNDFRLQLRGLEGDLNEGMLYPETHQHNTEVELAGTTFARTIEFINNYQIEFENGNYRVRLAGSNNNIADVAVVNNVSLLVQNSAGLIVREIDSGSGVPADLATKIEEIHALLGANAATPSVRNKATGTVTTGDIVIEVEDTTNERTVRRV